MLLQNGISMCGFFSYALLTTRKGKKNIIYWFPAKHRLNQQFQMRLQQENNKIEYTF